MHVLYRKDFMDDTGYTEDEKIALFRPETFFYFTLELVSVYCRYPTIHYY